MLILPRFQPSCGAAAGKLMNTVLVDLTYLVAGIALIATLLAIAFPRRPLLGVSQHWGLQLWQLGLLGMIGGIQLQDWIAIALSGTAAVYWSWRLWRRKPAPETMDGAPLLRLVSANLLHQNSAFDRTLQAISALGADVIVLCEVTPEMRER